MYITKVKTGSELKRSLISQTDHTVHRIHEALFIQSLLDLILDIILISSMIWFPSPQQMRRSQLEKVWGWCWQRQTLKASKSKLKTYKVKRKTSKHTRLGHLLLDTNNPRGSRFLHKTTWMFIMTLFGTPLKHRPGDLEVYIKMKSIKSFFQVRDGIVKFTKYYFPLSKKQDKEFFKMPHVKCTCSQQIFMRALMQRF